MKRLTTFDDLNDVQKEFCKSLPLERQEKYLATLPPIREKSVPAMERKITAINARISTLTALQEWAIADVLRLGDIVEKLSAGEIEPNMVDLRRDLAWPKINGISIRSDRGPHQRKSNG